MISQSQERPVGVANKYYELTELDFEISCANEATWEEVVLVKQSEIISQLLGFVPARQSSLDCKISGGPHFLLYLVWCWIYIILVVSVTI